MSDYQIRIQSFRSVLNNRFILLLTSNSIEKSAVNAVLARTHSAEIGIKKASSRIGLLGRQLVLHISGESGGSRVSSVGRLATKFLLHPDAPRPILIVLIGFCWGNPRLTKLGDVIVSTSILSLNQRRVGPSGVTYVPLPLESKLELGTELLDRLNHKIAPENIRALPGQMVSLETHLASDPAREEILTKYPTVLGGEMEAYHFLPDVSDIRWLVLKTISDSGGDDTDQAKQKEAANHAVNVLQLLVQELEWRDFTSDWQTEPAAASFVDLLVGNTILVNATDVNVYGLNDYLNDTIGARLAVKLKRSSLEIEFGNDFSDLFCDLLLELTQNALRHGKANRVQISFFQKTIVFQDDGASFDPRTLGADGGGAIAWRTTEKTFFEGGDITFELRKQSKPYQNMYIFRLKKTDTALQRAMEECVATIVPNTIRAPMGRPTVLRYDPACEAIYVDTSEIRMTSRRKQLASAIRDIIVESSSNITDESILTNKDKTIVEDIANIIKKGLTMFIACTSERDRVFYESELAGLPFDRIKIFVKSGRL